MNRSKVVTDRKADQITMIHSNSACIENGMFRVDRKFHEGMKIYVDALGEMILSVHPQTRVGEQTMDLVEIPVTQLGYRVMTVKVNDAMRASTTEAIRLREEIARSCVVYGSALGAGKLARSLGVPYISILECDLQTEIIKATSEAPNVARRAVRTARCISNYAMVNIPNMRGAYCLHCNGYPVFDEARVFNSNRLLYFDSRMSSQMVISEDQLRHRLSTRATRPLRLLFSGRYEPIKGAVNAVRVALASINQGLKIEMHCYGQGSQRAEMEQLASLAADHKSIQIHDAIPFPELVELSKTFDVFVCCHIQADPSCTYLESFGAGLPVIGYSNRMWRRLSEESGVGYCSPVGQTEVVADNIYRIAMDLNTLGQMSDRARRFASEHSFEQEFKLRIDSIKALIPSGSRNIAT